jgi:DNA-binding NarL/FixJ family response regulator
MTTALEVLLVDDHTLFRESLRRLLDAEPGFHVCAEFATAAEALAAVQAGLHFDVALLDYELVPAATTGSTGLDLLLQIRKIQPDARILMVTAGMDAHDLERTLKDLNAGIFLKTDPTAELLLALHRTARGERWVSSGAALTLISAEPRPPARETLSARESSVLRGVLEGLSNKEIGSRIGLTESSVKAVLQKLFEKAGVRSRSQLVRYAIEKQIDLR